jgi:phospholipid/cholesterol/gamma-HCH transport system substrate-binding protein
VNLTERNPLVIGIVAIVVILAGTFAALTIKGSTFSPTYSISADFRDASGLQGGDLVTIAGVAVGHVGSVKQDGDAVRVTMKMNHGVQVAVGSTPAIKVATLLGRMEVTLTPPPNANWDDLYQKGDHLPGLGGSPTQVLDVQADAQAALASLNAQTLNQFLSDLSQVTAGKADQVDSIIDGLNKLTSTVNDRSGEVSNLIDAANAVSGTVESQNQQLLNAIDSLDEVVANLDARRQELTDLLSSTVQAASQISGLIGTNRAKLDAVLTELQSALNVINAHQVDLAQTVSYLAGALEGFSSVGYSGAQDTPNTWANIYTVGVGPASPDPIFGCDGELDAILTQVIGADPVTSCAQYTGPLPGGGGASLAGPETPQVPASVEKGVPGAAQAPTAATTRDSLNDLLVPLLTVGNNLAAGQNLTAPGQ